MVLILKILRNKELLHKYKTRDGVVIAEAENDCPPWTPPPSYCFGSFREPGREKLWVGRRDWEWLSGSAFVWFLELCLACQPSGHVQAEAKRSLANTDAAVVHVVSGKTL